MDLLDTKIVEKIQKLLALSESSNENEAQVAMLKAQELLAKQKLSLKEVKEFKVFHSAIKEKRAQYRLLKQSGRRSLHF